MKKLISIFAVVLVLVFSCVPAFADSIDSAGETAHEYISKGTELFNGFMGVAPASVIALVAFGVVFLVIRKIVGR